MSTQALTYTGFYMNTNMFSWIHISTDRHLHGTHTWMNTCTCVYICIHTWLLSGPVSMSLLSLARMEEAGHLLAPGQENVSWQRFLSGQMI